MADTVIDRIRKFRELASPAVSQNSEMTTWEPTGEVIPVSEYTHRQAEQGRATKSAPMPGDDEVVVGVPNWLREERAMGVRSTPTRLSDTLPAPGAASARRQAGAKPPTLSHDAMRAEWQHANAGNASYDDYLKSMTVWEPTGEVIPVSEYNRRQAAAGRATKEQWLAGDPNELENGVPKWLRYERSTGAIPSPQTLADRMPAPGAAAAAAQQAAAGKPVARPAAGKRAARPPAPQQPVGPVAQLVSELSQRGAPPRMPAPGEAYAAARQAIDAEKSAGKPAAPEPERGILPGEEQVTTFDTFRMLNPSMRKGVESVYAASGHEGGIPFEDWLSETYGDLPPAARTAAMEATAIEHGVSLDEPAGLPANAASPLARDRVARDMPLPEGRDLRQYSPEQRKVMAENLHNPEVPMTPFGGTFTLTSEGAKSIRAPDPNLIATAEAAARMHGEGSQPHIIALAKAMHIDTSKYRQRDYDMLVADTMREKARYDAKQASSDIERMPTGAFRYVPNERTQENVATRNRQAMARTIGNRYARMLTPEQAQMLDDAANSESGVEVMRGLNEQLRRQYERDRHRDVGNRAANYNISQDLRNPNYAPGMNVRTLIEAVRSGDPQMAGAAYDIMGNPAAAAQSRQLAASFANADATSNAAQVEAANSMAMARLEAETQKAVAGMREGTPEDAKMVADLQQEQMNSIYALETPDEQLNAMRTFVQRVSPDLPAPQVEARAMANIAAHRARKHGINDPVVQAHLTNLFNTDRNAFMQFAQISLGMTLPQAKEFYTSQRTLLGKAAGLVGF